MAAEPRFQASLAPSVRVGVGGGETWENHICTGHLRSSPPYVINLDPLYKFPFLLYWYEIHYLDSSINNLNPQLRIHMWNWAQWWHSDLT